MTADLLYERPGLPPPLDPAGTARPPLAVDLDGTLVHSDTFHESIISIFRRTPLKTLALGRSLQDGKAAVKRAVAGSAELNPAMLPYNAELISYLRTERESGRRIGLFTAADQSIADAVADHLGLFDLARGSDGTTNLSGTNKASAIESEFGPCFAYAGDSTVDLPIFARASSVVLAGPVDRLQAKLDAGVHVEATFPQPRAGIGVWVRALRMQHWSKNILVFVAPLLDNRPVPVLSMLLLFVVLGMFASATYLLNDLMDLAADRAHPVKRLRPFACGAISVRDGVFAAGALIVGAFVASLLLPASCVLVLLAYLVITLLYTLYLKHLAMIDVTILAGLFTLRVLAGSVMVSDVTSPWLLTFSMLFFLGLAATKRYAELYRIGGSMENGGTARGYSQQDLPILLATGVATGLSAIVIFMIYLINDQYPRAVYAHPGALWGVMPILLVWTLRLWHLAVNGRMSEDPVVFALKDRFSLALGGVIVVIMLAARL